MKSLRVLLLLPLMAQAEIIRLAATPALTPDGSELVFEWQEDLWIVSSTGGTARALTRHPALDRFPVVSPDGRELAFMSGRDDTFQTYVMPLSGGEPRQVTFNSEGAAPQDWFPDGRHLLVRGSRDAGSFLPHRLIRIDTRERRPEEILFDDYADWGRVSPDGASILFQRDGDDIYRFGYRGSKAARVVQYDLAKDRFEVLRKAEDGSESRWPLWKPDGKGFYFTGESPRGGFNIVEQSIGGEARVRTQLSGYGVIMPTLSRDGRVMVFRHGFDFYRWCPAEEAPPQRIEIHAFGEAAEPASTRLSINRASNVDYSGSVDFTDDGAQIVFAAQGDLFVMDTSLRDPVAVTTGTLDFDNWAFFSPGASNLYFLRDRGDRVNIWRARRKEPALPWWRNRSFETEALTDDDRGRTHFSLDPKGQQFAWTEKPGALWVSGLDGRSAREIFRSPGEIYYDWSPDGLWMAVSAENSDDNWDIWIVSTTGAREPFNVSRHPNWDGGAAWSPDGRCLAYIGRTYDNEVDLYYVWLRLEDHGRSEKEIKSADLALKQKESKANPEPAKAPVSNRVSAVVATNVALSVQIDFDGLEKRIQRIAMPGSSPRNLFWSWDSKALAFQGRIDGKDGTWKIFFPNPGKPEFMTASKGEWARWSEKSVFWSVDETPAALDTRYPFTVQIERDTRDWRRLAFRRMWRAMRDEFYDPALNQIDWTNLLVRYDGVLDQLDQGGFVRAVNMMFGELNASHLDYRMDESAVRFGGAWKWQTGHLGARFDGSYTGAGVRVASVLKGAPASRPLTALRTGDVVIAINGEPVDRLFDLSRVLNGALPRDVDLSVLSAGSNRIVRLPLIAYDKARELASQELIEAARARVHERGGGRLGYLSIAGMQTDDLRLFEKEVYAQGYGHDALVIDVRNNTGGFTADQILTILCQPRHAVTIPRGGEVSYQGGYIGRPFWFKPVIVLCNPYTASNGEIFSHAIRNLGRGQLVGEATQGSVISTLTRSILDLGKYRVPHRGWFPQPSGLDMEAEGAQPDIVVEMPIHGRGIREDPQLDRAIDTILKDLPPGGLARPSVRYATQEKPVSLADESVPR